MRCVFDTNAIISAMLSKTAMPGVGLARAYGAGEILVSVSLMRELHDVLSRPKFDRYVTPSERERFLGLLLRDAHLVEVTESIRACRDPKDDQVLELAVCGRADWIIIGDADLLVLDPFRSIRIVTPTDFLGLGVHS